MEATLAALSSSRFYDLIRSFASRRAVEPVQFDILRVQNPSIQRLCEPPRNCCDSDWLSRPEVRGPDEVVRFLDGHRLPEQGHVTIALFVDERCGIIGFQPIESQTLSAEAASSFILRLASDYHASAVILATRDPSGWLSRSTEYQHLALELRRKGDAIEVPLLDHFFLTDTGWKRMFSVRSADRPS